jgi:rhodanese-related sulfurtransferase
MRRYLEPRVWAGGWIVAAGVCICVVFNLASRHGVLAPESNGKPGKPSVRPVYGVSSSEGTNGHVEKRAAAGKRQAVDPNEPPPVAAAYVLVRNHPAAATVTEASRVVDEGPVEMTVISLAQATKYVESGGAIFVDARSAQRFAMGHIPGSRNVPSSDFDNGYARNSSRLPKDGKVIVYCESASCDQAEEVGKKLIEKGYRKVLHFKDGWLVWEFSDQVQEKGVEQ